jgi:hypothetical protein
MAGIIQAIFVDPPIAIARLGGSNVPQDAYRWVEALNPRSDGNTVIAPWWTLDIMGDGSVEPRLPTSVRLRDGDLIRPVAPFFEIWAMVGTRGSPRSQWRKERLTPALLNEHGADESALTIEVNAQNRKVARRTGDKNLVFGTYPPLRIAGNDYSVQTLSATSPPEAPIAMIPDGQHIPLGTVRVIKSRKQPVGTGVAWEDTVNVEVIRFRYTPAPGAFYGPPQAAIDTGPRRHGIAVDSVNAFLDPDAGWYDTRAIPTVEPGDTYDTLIPETNTVSIQPSLGVVDDTCEARVTVTLALPGRKPRTLQAHANIFVGPPDFAPDRRPFLSLADELGDRGSDAAERNAALSKKEREIWIQDLFERIYETVSLFNLDHFQNDRSILLKGRRLRPKPLPQDHVSTPRNHAMTNKDRLRTVGDKVESRSTDEPLPLSELARDRHRSFQDIDRLKNLIALQPNRLKALIRQPFEVERDETANGTTMRMPPFMRNSNAYPLTLSVWQYELLMQWVRSQRRRAKAALADETDIMSPEAATRLSATLKRIPRGKAR